MHPVLLLDEVLRIILDHIDRDLDRLPALKTFYHLATVCRAWKDPALDYLWASLASVDPLLALLPHDVPCGYNRSDPLTLFHAYASRVRNVGQGMCSLPRRVLYPNLVDANTSESPVLPSLRSVNLDLKEATRQDFPLALYLSYSLQSIIIDVGFRTTKDTRRHHESLYVYLDAVARVSTNLQHLCLRGRLSDRVVNSIAFMRELHSLSVCGGSQLMPRTLASIACFQNLENLRLQLDWPNVSDLTEGFGGVSSNTALFPSLRALRIRISPAAAEVFFTHLPEGRLHTVHLESDTKPRSIDSWTPALAILAEKTHSSLTDLSFEVLTSFCEAFDDVSPPKLHITLATLTPLARLAHLRRFALDACVPPDLSDADLVTIASWWPKIEELTLWSRPVESFDLPAYFTTQSRAATPASLTVLAGRCPRLRMLCFPTDVTVLPQLAHPPLVVPSQTALTRLTIGCVRTGKTIDPAGLAECIYRAFPELEEIEFDCELRGRTSFRPSFLTSPNNLAKYHLVMEGSLSYSASLIRSCGLVVSTARASIYDINIPPVEWFECRKTPRDTSFSHPQFQNRVCSETEPENSLRYLDAPTQTTKKINTNSDRIIETSATTSLLKIASKDWL